MHGRHKLEIEYRSYELPPRFPLRILHGDHWRISDIPSGVLHFHNCLEIGLCESDSGKLQFQDTVMDFKAGDITILSSDMPHSTFSSPGTASKWSYIFVDAEALFNCFIPLETLPNSDDYKNILYNFRAVLDASEGAMLRHIIEDIIREVELAATGYEITVRSLLLAFFSKIIREHTLKQSSSMADAMPISPALRQINERYMDDFSMNDLAELCLMSSSHFRRVFVEIMGFGPLEHLNRTRIQKACSMLRMTDKSILAVSEAVGFRSQSSFNRHFASLMSESPSEWRKRMNADQGVSVHRYEGWLIPDIPK